MSTQAQPADLQKRQRNWAWIWLCYTGFLFIDPIFDPRPAMWLGTLAVLVTFLGIFALYVRATDSGSPFRHGMIAATFALGLVAFPWNQGASCLFIYAAAFVPFTVESVRRVVLIILAECLVVFAEGWYFTLHVAPHTAFHVGWPNTLIAIFLMLVIGGGNIFFAEQKRADCRLRAAEEQNVALAAVAERERIARDLHDVLGHTLSVITLKAELAGRLIAADPTRAAAEIADVERLARTSLAEVREAITGYRAQGLAAEIEAARKTLDSAGVRLVLENEASGATLASNSDPALSAGLSAAEETVLALALREAVTNIVRHARATTCTLRFVADAGVRRIVVEDNGQHPATREGNGLRGMRERIESIGGQLTLERETGTRLLITLPLQTETA
jgi:two-component system sensor histidine kinase DesK